jgi:hypothetical protein
MSDEGFLGVPGVPEGWKLVHANRNVQFGEHYIGLEGKVLQWGATKQSLDFYPIIRKIEPKYRACKGASEAEPFWNEALKLAMPCGQSANTRFRICVMTDKGIRIGIDFYSYAIAFHRFVCADGTPFGVKIDER